MAVGGAACPQAAGDSCRGVVSWVNKKGQQKHNKCYGCLLPFLVPPEKCLENVTARTRTTLPFVDISEDLAMGAA